MHRKPAHALVSPHKSTRTSPAGTSPFWGRDGRQSATIGAVGSAEGPSGTQLQRHLENEWKSDDALDEMDEMLTKLDCSAAIKRKFKEQKIFPSTIKLLNDDQLKELGIDAIGDRARLRQMSSSLDNHVTLRNEVKAIFQPYPKQSHNSPYLQQSFPSLIERRSKGKGKDKLRFIHAKYIQKPRKSIKFQKKLVVIRHMGARPPSTFTIKEDLIFLRGMLPEFEYASDELYIRRSIVDMINGSVDAPIDLHDFEFLEAAGKQLCVPAKTDELEWTGRAVKQLAGSGCVYIRLTHDSKKFNSDSSPDVELLKVERPGTMITHPRQKSKRRRKLIFEPKSETRKDDSDTQDILDDSTSWNNQTDAVLEDNSSFIADSTVSMLDSSAYSTSFNADSPRNQSDILPSSQQGPTTHCFLNKSNASVSSNSQNQSDIKHVQSHVPQKNQQDDKMNGFELPSCSVSSKILDEKLSFLINVFPDMSTEQIMFLLKLVKGDPNAVCNILLEGERSAQSLIRLWKQTGMWKQDIEVRRIRVETYKAEETLEELFSFYKSNRYNPYAVVRISIEDQPAVDTGGIRRQFYNDALLKLSNTEDLFERTDSGILPIFRQSTLSSGLFTTIGKLIGHSIIMDEQGFPFMSPAIYYYMAGLADTAVSVVTMGDLGCYTKHIITKLNSVTTLDELDNKFKETVLDMMTQCGCDVELNVKNIPAICESVMLYDVFHKRKLCFDGILEGLEVYKLKTMIEMFPEQFKYLFVMQQCKPSDVIASLRFYSREAREKEIEELFKKTVANMNISELEAFLRSITGCKVFIGKPIHISFHDDPDLPAFSISTCGCQVDISKLIEIDEGSFTAALKAVMSGSQNDFNMP